MKLLIGCLVVLNLFSCHIVLGDLYSITDLCQSVPSHLRTLTIYSDMEHELKLDGTRSGYMRICTLNLYSPTAALGTSFRLDVTFDSTYSVGFDTATSKLSTSDVGLKVVELPSFAYWVGNHTTYWAGKNDGTGTGSGFAGDALPTTSRSVSRTSNTAGPLLLIKYRGTQPQDQLTMKVKMTCTPGPCPTKPPTTVPPTTALPTTAPPTTALPTTALPTTAPPTTAPPNTSTAGKITRGKVSTGAPRNDQTTSSAVSTLASINLLALSVGWFFLSYGCREM